MDTRNDGPGTNNGHGHVWERPDRRRMRCGGPVICRVCAKDAARWAKTVTFKDVQSGAKVELIE